MAAALAEAGKTEIAAQEFTALLSFAPRERGEDEWRRTSGIHRIRKPRALAVVRALWHTRDEIAQRRDIAVGRILPDASIAAAAQATLTSMDDLARLKEFNGRGAQRYLNRWWAAIAEAQQLPADQLPAASVPPTGPPPPRSWADRDPAAFARLSAARTALAGIAEDLGLPGREPPVPRHRPATVLVTARAGRRGRRLRLPARGRCPPVAGRRDGLGPVRGAPGPAVARHGYWRVASEVTGR